MEVEYSDHRRPLYMMATINDVQIRKALIHIRASLNLITLNTLEAIGMAGRKILGAPVEITGFKGAIQSTEGYVQLALRVGPIVALTRFHIINTKVSYHILLGRPRLHKHHIVPLMYVSKELNGRIPANPNSFS